MDLEAPLQATHNIFVWVLLSSHLFHFLVAIQDVCIQRRCQTSQGLRRLPTVSENRTSKVRARGQLRPLIRDATWVGVPQNDQRGYCQSRKLPGSTQYQTKMFAYPTYESASEELEFITGASTLPKSDNVKGNRADQFSPNHKCIKAPTVRPIRLRFTDLLCCVRVL